VGADVGTRVVVATGTGVETRVVVATGTGVETGVVVAVGVGVAGVTVGTDWPPQATSRPALKARRKGQRKNITWRIVTTPV